MRRAETHKGSLVEGAVQRAGRSSSLESGSDLMEAIDLEVRQQIEPVVPHGELRVSRRSYHDFNDVLSPEDFVDGNNNATYDYGECFTDANGNGQWDEDRGRDGLGGAQDVVQYTATLEYDRFLPVNLLTGGRSRHRLVASTILRSQPYADHGDRQLEQVCPQ